jgi:hypothetical protein
MSRVAISTAASADTTDRDARQVTGKVADQHDLDALEVGISLDREVESVEADQVLGCDRLAPDPPPPDPRRANLRAVSFSMSAIVSRSSDLNCAGSCLNRSPRTSTYRSAAIQFWVSEVCAVIFVVRSHAI